MNLNRIHRDISHMCPSYHSGYCEANHSASCEPGNCPFIFWEKIFEYVNILEEEDS